mmetsp:Transcript_2320/g.5446  ORF Transcript_2320/g.5446 Transcript_2320/m.5446 type:complete len:122 (+) Transcript_2320:1237-1602(+)
MRSGTNERRLVRLDDGTETETQRGQIVPEAMYKASSSLFQQAQTELENARSLFYQGNKPDALAAIGTGIRLARRCRAMSLPGAGRAVASLVEGELLRWRGDIECLGGNSEAAKAAYVDDVR